MLSKWSPDTKVTVAGLVYAVGVLASAIASRRGYPIDVDACVAVVGAIATGLAYFVPNQWQRLKPIYAEDVDEKMLCVYEELLNGAIEPHVRPMTPEQHYALAEAAKRLMVNALRFIASQ
jgi:diacylglycerol kinase